jgi:RimJ/RimL family protein N-acetyltransferase
MTEIDHRSHVALVAHPELDIDEAEEPVIVADARYVRLDGRRAEFAVAVDDRWQRQGLGSRLLRMLARHAAKNGLGTLYGDVLADNLPMITMLQRWGCELQARDDEPGLLLATIVL